MKIVFDGTVLVFACFVVDSDLSYLVLEKGKGSGRIGETTTDPSRFAGVKVDIEEMEKDENIIVLEFLSPQSVSVLIEKLQELLSEKCIVVEPGKIGG